jgi:L-threonylcarbamoyladenylate synthase
LFPKNSKTPGCITGEHETVAIRVTAHEICIDLCAGFGGPVVSTSANPRSAPPARSSAEVEEYFGSYLGGILAGPLGGQESTSSIRDVRTGKVLR